MPLGLRAWFAGRVAGPVVEMDWWQSVQHKSSSNSSTGGQSRCVDAVWVWGALGLDDVACHTCNDAAAALDETCVPGTLRRGGALQVARYPALLHTSCLYLPTTKRRCTLG